MAAGYVKSCALPIDNHQSGIAVAIAHPGRDVTVRMPDVAITPVVQMAGCMTGVPRHVTAAVMAAIVVAVISLGMVALIAMVAPLVVAAVALAGQRHRADEQRQAEENYLCRTLHIVYSIWLNTAQVCTRGTE